MGKRMRCRRPAGTAGALVLLTMVALMVSSGPAFASRSYQCQHPTTTGEEAFNLHQVTPARACAVVRALARYVHSLTTVRASRGFYTCRRHRPTLHRRMLDGWRLTIAHGGAFTMSRGHSRFSVGGTDFPVPC